MSAASTFTTILAKMRLRLTQINFVESRLLGKTFLLPLFCLLWKMHSGKKSLCGNSGFIAFLKLGEMESFPSFRFLIERLTLKSSGFTKNVQGGPTSFELLFYHFWSNLSHYWILLDCVSRQFLGNFWATFRPFSVYF